MGFAYFVFLAKCRVDINQQLLMHFIVSLFLRLCFPSIASSVHVVCNANFSSEAKKTIVDEHGKNIANACMVAIRAHAIDGLIGSPGVNQYKMMVVNRFIYFLATLLPKTLSGGRLLRVKPALSSSGSDSR